MDGLGDLFKQIGQIDSSLKLIGFLASIVVIIVLALLKKQTDLPKNVMNILMTLFVMVFLLALTAMFIRPGPIDHETPLTYTLSVTVTDSAGNPYRTDQVEVTVNNQYASGGNSFASNTWNFIFREGELPPDRTVYISAHTKDKVYSANVWDTLNRSPIQSRLLLLSKAPVTPVTPVTTFSINLSDHAIRDSIARITGLKYDPASTINKIIVTYDRNSVAKDGQNIYYLKPSHPVVLIDGQRFTLEGCTFQPNMDDKSKHPDRLIEDAEKGSVDVATSFLKRKPNVLAQWLKSMQH
jgi:hypothetical protein